MALVRPLLHLEKVGIQSRFAKTNKQTYKQTNKQTDFPGSFPSSLKIPPVFYFSLCFPLTSVGYRRHQTLGKKQPEFMKIWASNLEHVSSHFWKKWARVWECSSRLVYCEATVFPHFITPTFSTVNENDPSAYHIVSFWKSNNLWASGKLLVLCLAHLELSEPIVLVIDH